MPQKTLKVWKPSQQDPIYLALQQDRDSVSVVVVDSQGKPIDRGTVLSVSSAGLHLTECIHEDIGLRLDSKGRIFRF